MSFLVNLLRLLVTGLWTVLDSVRKVLHLILLFVLAAIIIAALSPKLPIVPSKAALVIRPEGRLVEQLEGSNLDRAINKALGDGVPQTLARDLIEAIERAQDDPRIEVVFLDLDQMAGGGLSKLQDLGKALDAFRASGKKVIAAGDYYGQGQYYLAARADEIYMHPLGVVFIDGYERYRSYYKELLDTLAVDWNVFSVGEYKSFSEPFTRNDMSEADREASRTYLQALWAAYRTGVTEARNLEPGAIEAYVENFVEVLDRLSGDLAATALESGLVDQLWDRPRVRQRLIELVGEDEDGETFVQVHYQDYLNAVRPALPEDGQKGNVAVIVASGTIVGGEQPPGTIGADSLVKIIRKVKKDDDIAALVLRVDSGGGSRFASEVIRGELEALQESGKPVVASMSSVAASGGYWISVSADEIWASPTTLTGSIGVIAMLPTFQRTLGKIGINVDGVGTTRLSGAFRPDLGLTDDARDILRLSTENAYQDFVSLVSNERDLGLEVVSQIAKGRVWTGQQAQEMGLVDSLGDLSEAIEAAAKIAELEDYEVRFLEQEEDPMDQFIAELLGGAAGLFVRVLGPASPSAMLERAFSGVLGDLQNLTRFADPHSVYLYCFCGTE